MMESWIMEYLPLDRFYAEKQNEFYEKQLDNKPDPGRNPEKYGIPASFEYLNEILYKKHPVRGYGKDTPVVHMAPFMESVPLGRDYMGFGLRGFWIVGDTRNYRSATDKDPWRVDEHENIHRGMAMWDRNHPEWLVRIIENLRLGDENYN